MDSVWFSCCDDSEISEAESSFPIMGVFRESPQDIASWLPRPEAPQLAPSSVPERSYGMSGLTSPSSVPRLRRLTSWDTEEISVY